MPRIVRGALVQASWTGDKESMIQKHEERARTRPRSRAPSSSCSRSSSTARTSARSRTRSTTATPSSSPTARRRSGCRTSPSRPAWSSSRRCTRRTRQASGIYYNTAAVIDADGTYLGKYRKTHIPHVKGFWEKFYFRPGNLGYPVFETAVGKVGVYICYDRHFPEGARALGLNGAEIVLIPTATSRGLSEYLWRSSSRAMRSPTATTSGRSTGSASSRSRRRRLLRPELLRRPARPVRRRRRLRPRRGADRPRPRPRHGSPRSATLAVLPRPTARRYDDLTRALGCHAPAADAARSAENVGVLIRAPARLRLEEDSRAACSLSGTPRGGRDRCSSGSRSSPTTRSSARSP